MNYFRNKDILEKTGISKMQAAHWVQVGAILPWKDSPGRGGKRLYSFENLLEFLVCAELNKFKIEARFMKWALNWLRSFGPEQGMNCWAHLRKNPDVDYYFVVYPNPIPEMVNVSPDRQFGYGYKSGKGLMETLAKDPTAIVVNLTHLLKKAEG